VAAGDAWVCTNPSIGRGASIGLLHVLALRDLLRTSAAEDPAAFTSHWETVTLQPWNRGTGPPWDMTAIASPKSRRP
jgi:hypothetical protein